MINTKQQIPQKDVNDKDYCLGSGAILEKTYTLKGYIYKILCWECKKSFEYCTEKPYGWNDEAIVPKHYKD